MYRNGHVGVGLLAYAPVGYVLLSIARPRLAVAGFVLVVWLAMVPDLDTRTRLLAHRGVTHTIGFVAVFGAVCGAAGWFLGGHLAGVAPRALTVFGVGVGALVVVAHLVADWLTPMGIAPFWPISSRRYSLDLVPASNAVANYVLFGLGAGATVVALRFAGVL